MQHHMIYYKYPALSEEWWWQWWWWWWWYWRWRWW